MRQLQNTDLLQIEIWASQGLGADNIAILLGLAPADFRELAAEDPRINQSLLYGRNRGIQQVSQALFGSATSGRDSGASRFYLERLGPAEFRPPRAAPIILVEAAKPSPQDEARVIEMELRFERQRLLASGLDIIDGNVVNLQPVGAPVTTLADLADQNKENPPPDAGGGKFEKPSKEECVRRVIP